MKLKHKKYAREFISKEDFIKFCDLYQSASDDVETINDCGVDLGDLQNKFEMQIELLLRAHFKRDSDFEMVIEFLSYEWDGEVFDDDGRLIMTIETHGELYDFVLQKQ